MRYTMIRGKAQRARCVYKDESPLYCKCGCQTPRETDPRLAEILTGVMVGKRSDDPRQYAVVDLMRKGQRVGCIDTQYGYLCIDGVEYLGCAGIDAILAAARAIRHDDDRPQVAPLTLGEVAVREHVADDLALAEQDARHQCKNGYCTKCHSYCYGDCEAG